MVRIGRAKGGPVTKKKEITGVEQAIRLHGAVVNVLVDGFEKAF